jgi:hypothetical protein
MKRRSSIQLALIGMLLALSAPCRADEDGFFCAAKGYLAYNVRSGTATGVTGHVLKVVRFDSTHGIHFAEQVTLQDFQVHRMICDPDRIEISGYGSIFKKYTVTISEETGPQIADFTEDAARRFDLSKDGPEPAIFSGGQPGTQTVPLASDSPSQMHQLVLTHSVRKAEGGLEHRYKAELRSLNPQRKIVQRVVLYEGRSLETID